MGAPGSAKSRRGCGSWVLGTILLVVAVGIVGALLVPKNPQLAAQLDSFLTIGLKNVPTGTTDRLQVDRALGFVVTAAWNGENVEDEQYEVDDGVITVFDEAGGVLCSVPFDEVHRPAWQALSPWERVGFWPEQDGSSMLVSSLRPGSPAQAAGLARGDVIERCAGQPAAAMTLRAALIAYLPGGELSLQVSRDGQTLDLTVSLPELMPAEQLEGSSDPLGAWMTHAAARDQG